MSKTERERWQHVADRFGDRRIKLGPMQSYIFTNTPRRMLYTLSYYKFAAKMIGAGRRVLDVGCGEGMGTWLLSDITGNATGIDFDSESIDAANENWGSDTRVNFLCTDFFMWRAPYDAAVSFDVIEHILPDNADMFLSRLASMLSPHGTAVIGTPNITSDQYASETTQAGHVNLYSGDRLVAALRKHFYHVFLFSANDEVVHTGFTPLAHYLIAVACGPI